MKKILFLCLLAVLASVAFATSASAAGRPRPIIIINPPVTNPQPIQSAQ